MSETKGEDPWRMGGLLWNATERGRYGLELTADELAALDAWHKAHPIKWVRRECCICRKRCRFAEKEPTICELCQGEIYRRAIKLTQDSSGQPGLWTVMIAMEMHREHR